MCFQITATDDICIVKDQTYRKLIIKNCKEEDAGKYRCEADGRKTEAVLKVEGTDLRIYRFGTHKKKRCHVVPCSLHKTSIIHFH